MLTDYIEAAMEHAEYEKLTDGSWYSEIPGLEGLWATGPTVEACRAELRSALEDWIVFGLLNGYAVPPIDGIDLMAAQRIAA
jgi:predicted RNase H-like HicB family nuclease